MDFFFDATTLTFLRDACIIAAFYLTIEHGLKSLRRNVARVRVSPRVSPRDSQRPTHIDTHRSF